MQEATGLTDRTQSWLDPSKRGFEAGMSFGASEAPFAIGYDPTEGMLIVALGGVREPEDLAMIVENLVTNYWNQLVDVLIPFYGFVYDFILSSFFTFMSQNAVIAFFGANTVSLTRGFELRVMLDLNLQLAEALLEKRDQRFSSVIIAGHGSGALYGKALARSLRHEALVFEGPAYARSPIAAFLGTESSSTTESGIISVVSGSSFVAQDEEGQPTILTDYSAPILGLPNPYQTFCYLAAGCVRDSRFDSMCAHGVGTETYHDYFASWNRPYLEEFNTTL
jgi:hypothetical protein